MVVIGPARRRDERGAILILSVVGVVAAVIAAALAVDLGTLAQEKRRAQKVADLAALDAVRGLNDLYVTSLGRVDLTAVTPTRDRARILATESALRNGFDPADTVHGHSLVVDLGVYDTSQPDNFRPTCPPPGPVPCADDSGANAVKVKVGSDVRFDFRPGTRRITVDAIAFQDSAAPPPSSTTTTSTTVPPPTTTVPPSPTTASFSIGSSLVNLNTSSSTLLNPIVGQMIGSSINLSLASWQGLASGNVTLGALQTELAKMGFSVGTVSQLLGANLTLAQMYQATANALTLTGDTANANVFDVLKAAAKATAVVKLGELVKVQTGTDDAAVLGTSLKLLQLVTGSAEAVNGANTASVSGVGVTVPGVSRTDLSLKVTELPQVYIGPVGGSVSTGQVELTTTTQLNLDVQVGLSVVHVTGPLPVNLELAGATGTLTSANCSSSKGSVVTADPKAFDGLGKTATLRASTLLGIPLLDVGTTTATPSVDGPPVALSFSYPTEFLTTTKHAGSQPLGLQSLTSVTPGTVTVLGAIPLGLTANDVVTAVMNALHPVIGNVDGNVLTPLLTAMGVDIGGADVTALGLNCATTTTNSTSTSTTTSTTIATTTTTVLPVPSGPPKLVS